MRTGQREIILVTRQAAVIEASMLDESRNNFMAASTTRNRTGVIRRMLC